MTWQTLQQALDELAGRDPVVAAAAKSLDDTIDRLIDHAALHRFRPLPWDRESQSGGPVTATENLHHAYTFTEELDAVKAEAEQNADSETDGWRTKIHLGVHVDDKCTPECVVWPPKKK